MIAILFCFLFLLPKLHIRISFYYYFCEPVVSCQCTCAFGIDGAAQNLTTMAVCAACSKMPTSLIEQMTAYVSATRMVMATKLATESMFIRIGSSRKYS